MITSTDNDYNAYYLFYPSKTNHCGRLAVRRCRVTGAEQAAQESAHSFDSNSSVDGMGRRCRDSTGLRRGVVVTDRLEDGSDCCNKHADEHSGVERRSSPHSCSQCPFHFLGSRYPSIMYTNYPDSDTLLSLWSLVPLLSV